MKRDARKAPCGIQHTDGESVETTRKRVENSHFTDSLTCHQNHESHDEPVNHEGPRTSHGKSASGTDEKTGAN